MIGLSAAALLKDTKRERGRLLPLFTKPVKVLELTQVLEEILLRDRA